jgi:hypothetical protein
VSSLRLSLQPQGLVHRRNLAEVVATSPATATHRFEAATRNAAAVAGVSLRREVSSTPHAASALWFFVSSQRAGAPERTRAAHWENPPIPRAVGASFFAAGPPSTVPRARPGGRAQGSDQRTGDSEGDGADTAPIVCRDKDGTATQAGSYGAIDGTATRPTQAGSSGASPRILAALRCA